ncbi:hypothetical protein GE21DRAFT_1080966 [Neurospora crassa]|nr:hypothetical protein GE21DRAFT_1080966 [Neurospora crassa]
MTSLPSSTSRPRKGKVTCDRHHAYMCPDRRRETWSLYRCSYTLPYLTLPHLPLPIISRSTNTLFWPVRFTRVAPLPFASHHFSSSNQTQNVHTRFQATSRHTYSERTQLIFAHLLFFFLLLFRSFPRSTTAPPSSQPPPSTCELV